MTRLSLVAAVAVLCAASGFAQSTVPETDLAALQRAVQEAPHDPSLLQRLSQAYAIVDQPVAALDAIERALALSPDSVDFIRARATLATWVADYGRARDSYLRLRTLHPQDHDVVLNLARVSAWGGRTDAAVESYRQYLDARPDAADVWIELARAEGWRGNYATALEALEEYRHRSAADDAYSRERAAILARAGRPGQALDTLEPLLRQRPDDYDLNLTRTIALTMQRKAREASQALETVKRLQPQARDTRTTERIVREVLASTADPEVSAYGDSSGLEVQRVVPRVSVSLSSGTTLGAGFEHERLSASAGSGLEPIGGNLFARHQQLWISAAQNAGSVVLRGRAGRAKAATHDLTSYSIGADVTPFDGLKLSAERNSSFFVVSPRTVGLGLRQTGHRGQFDWSPTVRSRVFVDAVHQTLSDGNRRWEFTISPRHSVARTQRLNLDLGIVASQIRTRTNYDNGYYDPRLYEYYAAAVYPYWKIRDSIGAGLSLALGVQRDDFSLAFQFGGNLSGDVTFGIFNPWALKVTGGATFNQRLESGAFRGYSAGVSLVRRF